MIEIFNLFKRKKDTEDFHTVQENNQENSVLEDGKISLKEIEKFLCTINDQKIFTSLLSFIAYYSFIISYYEEHIDSIISVKELLLLKYIPMVREILVSFDEKNASQKEKEQLVNTICEMNKKLYVTIEGIKEQQQLNLQVDLKTVQDLIKSDF
ncbi:hypothetical protein FQB35_14025 [Crassaminicella thermophila]|uniref:Uncharacterized protein n=1 Tax=Crassaminicella thermophila TaxID=2599308 RepID=A0A5C0SJ89_CRATE|nr:hypothetical protein [Crassaminicella thermophila]QEK13298.1 hypothetical protein FQB35_14025 [Crassaminicella thermophila]